MIIQKKLWGSVRGGGGGGGGFGFGGLDGCERRLEVFVKIEIQKKMGGGGLGVLGSGWGVRLDVNEEL